MIVRSHWVVCEQEPKAGSFVETVRLVVARTCPAPRPTPGIVPNVTGWRLDEAEERLEELGFRFETYADDEIVVPANWIVCSQYPAGGDAGGSVDLYVEHDCE